MAANNLALLIAAVIGTLQETARSSGFILNLTSRDQRTDALAKGQTITYPTLPDIAAVDVTPGATAPDATGLTALAPANLTLNNQKAGQFKLTAEDERGLADLGPNYRFEGLNLAVAAVVDAICADVAQTMDKGAGLALGTLGTDPFATTPNILMDAWQSLADDKAPDSNRFGVLSTLDYASAGKLAQFQKVSEAPAGTDFAQARLGMLGNFLVGYDQYSGVSHTEVAAGGYLVNNGAGYAAGATDVTVDTGTGGFAAGDIVTIAGNVIPGTAILAQMIVKSATATVITFTRGLLTAVADNASVVRIATHRSSFLGHRSAVYTSIRPSAEVTGGDAAAFSQVIRDPQTGIALRLAYYKQYHQGMWEVSGVYGSVVRRPAWLRKLYR